MKPSILGLILFPILSGLALALFRRAFPARPADGQERRLSAEERRVYERWETAKALTFLILVAMVSCAWYFVLKSGASVFPHATTPATRFLIEPSPFFWALPAMFLAMISCAYPIEWLYRCMLRERYSRYERFSHERLGIDGRRAFPFLAFLIVAASAVFFVAGVTSFARFDEASVEIGRPLTFRSTYYNYARVKAIEHRATFRSPIGKTVRRPHFVIVFDDGSTWSARGGLRDPRPELDGRIAQLVARRSGRAIVERP